MQCSLQDLCLFAGVERDELARFDEIMQRRQSVAQGERLFRLREPLSLIYVAREGCFKSVCLHEDGEEHILGFHLPGELIGLDALGSGVHHCEAVALSPASVCSVSLTVLLAHAGELPNLYQQLLRMVGHRLDCDHGHMDLLLRRQAHERIALFLHRLGERYARLGKSSLRFLLPMRRNELASYLGLALETVSRGFTRLEEEGIITAHGRRVEVVDAEWLMLLAHADEAQSSI